MAKVSVLLVSKGHAFNHDAFLGMFEGDDGLDVTLVEQPAAQVLLRPASEGTGVIAGGGVRTLLELAGVRDVLAKSLGSNNQLNVVKATMDAISQLRSYEEITALRRG